MATYRATMHNGRTRQNGEVYSVKHNDRNCPKGDNINPEPERANRYFIAEVDGTVNSHPDKTFETHEKNIYEQLFSDMLRTKNERHLKAGHASRVRTMDEYRTSAKTCPEETILQLGTMDDYADPSAFVKAVNLWCCRMRDAYGANWHLLDGAIHFDEATPHCHIRAVWVATGADGMEVSQNKALDELGIEPPDPSKQKDRHNNPKQTFTAKSREFWIASARQYGISIEEEPDQPGKSTLTREQFIAETIRAETAELRVERQELQEQVKTLKEEQHRLNVVIRALKHIVQPLKALAEKLSKLICVDGKSALSHVSAEMNEVNRIESDLSDDSLCH